MPKATTPDDLQKNLTGRQFTALLGIISEPTGFEVDYPKSFGQKCTVKHFSGVLWVVEADGTVGQTTEHVGHPEVSE